jgi:hypothetical protein
MQAPCLRYVLFSLVFLTLISGCDDDDMPITNILNNCLSGGLQNGVIAYYSFSDGSLMDESGFSHHLTNPTLATASADRNGNPRCAYRFDATTTNEQFLTLTDASFLDGLGSFSVSAWYQALDTTILGVDLQVLVGRGDQPNCPNRRGEWMLGLFDSRRAVFGHNNSVWSLSQPGVSTVAEHIRENTNRWFHVVAVKDQDTYSLYRDGVLQETVTGTANCNNQHLAADTGNLFLGTNHHGDIDDVVIYNRALSTQEITDLFATGVCCE